MAEAQSVFGNLYDYSSSKGIIIPQTSDVYSKIVDGFKTIFGGNVATDPTTPIGRLIEALTLLFINVLGVNAQNANFLNPEQAIGNALDNLGAIFGIDRDGMTDADYRNLIMSAQSRGYGFAESIRRAVSAVDGVTTVAVLNNGNEDPAVIPNDEAGVAVAPHSVMVCVAGGDDTDIAQAIDKTISAGCGMVQEGFSTENTVTKTLTNAETGTSSTITFYRPTQVFARFSVSIRTDAYTGKDAAGDAKAAILGYIAKHNSAHAFTQADIITAIGADGVGLICTSAKIESKNVQGSWVNVDYITIRPNEFIDLNDETTTITVTVL